jgi:Xaa-Pro aminopeptidase
VGSGDNATVLHYVDNRSQLAAGQLVLIDAGVELQGYASDVTRTYPVGGRFEGAARDVYEVVLASQSAAFDAIRPGTTLRAIHEVAVRALVEGLVALGALAGDADELVKAEAYKPFYMHSTGHLLGLDVHDVGSYARGAQPRPLEPGMCFTVEPGLYFSTSEPQSPEHLRGIGVRIEDDVVLTPEGYETLTASIPKRIDDVEAWMRE